MNLGSLLAGADCQFLTVDVGEQVLAYAYRERAEHAWQDRRRRQAADVCANWTSFARSTPRYASLLDFPFSQLDRLSKRDLAGDGYLDLVRADVSAEHVWSKATSGSTGAPVTVVYGPGFYWSELFLSADDILRTAGRDVRDQSAVRLVHITDSDGTRDTALWSPFHESAFLRLQLHDLIDARLRILRPPIITARPEVLEVVATRISDCSYVKAIISSGSTLGSRRAMIESRFGVRATEAYTSTEFGTVAVRCPQSEIFHVDPSIVAEVLRNDGSMSASGEGQLVLSSANNEAMLLLRYETGDDVTLGSSQCECGYTGVSMLELGGRTVPTFELHSGPWLPTALNELAFACHTDDFQVIQEANDRVCVVLLRPTSPAEVARARRFVEARVPVGVAVSARAIYEAGPGKWQRYLRRTGDERCEQRALNDAGLA